MTHEGSPTSVLPFRRINFFGVPSAGKSTTALGMAAYMKAERRDVVTELATEYVKKWAYRGQVPSGFDQYYLFGKTIHQEEMLLKNGVDLVISDSPLWLSAFYADYSKVPAYSHLTHICAAFDRQYPALNILLDGRDRSYVQAGRYQTQTESSQMHDVLKDWLHPNIIFTQVSTHLLNQATYKNLLKVS